MRWRMMMRRGVHTRRGQTRVEGTEILWRAAAFALMIQRGGRRFVQRGDGRTCILHGAGQAKQAILVRTTDAHEAIILERHEFGVLSKADSNAAQSTNTASYSSTAAAASTASSTTAANAYTNDPATATAQAIDDASSTSTTSDTNATGTSSISMLHTAGMILQQSLLQPQQSAHQIRTQLVHAQLARLTASAGG